MILAKPSFHKPHFRNSDADEGIREYLQQHMRTESLYIPKGASAPWMQSLFSAFHYRLMDCQVPCVVLKKSADPSVEQIQAELRKNSPLILLNESAVDSQDAQKRKRSSESESDFTGSPLEKFPSDSRRDPVSGVQGSSPKSSSPEANQGAFANQAGEESPPWENTADPLTISTGKRMRMGGEMSRRKLATQEPSHRKWGSLSSTPSNRLRHSPASLSPNRDFLELGAVKTSPNTFDRDPDVDLFANLSIEPEKNYNPWKASRQKGDDHSDWLRQVLNEGKPQREQPRTKSETDTKVVDIETDIRENTKLLLMLANLKGGF